MRKTSQLSNLRRRVAVTLLTLLVYMLGSSIPVPFARFTKSFHHLLNNTPLSVVSFMSGANFQKLSLFMIGLNPLMIAMLIMQLLMMMKLFSLDSLSMRQMMVVQQFVTLILTLIQAVTLVIGLHLTSDILQAIAVIIILTAGSLFVVWMGYMNMEFGIGGTITIVLFNMVTMSLPNLKKAVQGITTLGHPVFWIVALILVGILAIVFWNAFGHAYYPVKTINTSMPSSAKPIIVPIGLNSGAMMTYMIGMALLMFPTMIGSLLGRDSIFANVYFDAIISGLLAFGLFYFFAFMQFNPKEQAKQLRNSNNYVLGIRPGKPTQEYLKQKLLRVSFWGALLNAIQLTLGLLGNQLLGKFAGFAVIPMNIVMLVMFMTGIKDQLLTLLFPSRYEKLMKKEG
ncbi:accessory Sec system protein translocase subunit SecY2 [Limosilactobacillus urinaemulieris]|uniref:accessory Sec system protein translocase subunit SecY2 n=1 Tax=Limosilactobacillus urinaemulieris TaxID=2742600 RepID=UPI0028F07409|nr:accessory Sec system protein translocase subunit SecY2 [Limosilactobacillus urinaemulieris]